MVNPFFINLDIGSDNRVHYDVSSRASGEVSVGPMDIHEPLLWAMPKEARDKAMSQAKKDFDWDF